MGSNQSAWYEPRLRLNKIQPGATIGNPLGNNNIGSFPTAYCKGETHIPVRTTHTGTNHFVGAGISVRRRSWFLPHTVVWNTIGSFPAAYSKGETHIPVRTTHTGTNHFVGAGISVGQRWAAFVV